MILLLMIGGNGGNGWIPQCAVQVAVAITLAAIDQLSNGQKLPAVKSHFRPLAGSVFVAIVRSRIHIEASAKDWNQLDQYSGRRR
jgi:hypothetical protein